MLHMICMRHPLLFFVIVSFVHVEILHNQQFAPATPMQAGLAYYVPFHTPPELHACLPELSSATNVTL